MNETSSLIDKIKKVREITGADLKTAKDAVDECGTAEAAVRKIRPIAAVGMSTQRDMDSTRWANLFRDCADQRERINLVDELTAAVLNEVAFRVQAKPIANSKVIAEMILEMKG